jgi:hypothetical protein
MNPLSAAVAQTQPATVAQTQPTASYRGVQVFFAPEGEQVRAQKYTFSRTNDIFNQHGWISPRQNSASRRELRFCSVRWQLNGPNFVGRGLKKMPKSMTREWLLAASETSQLAERGEMDEQVGGAMQRAVLLGGRWDPAELWRHMLELRERDPAIKAYLDGATKASL